MGSSGGAFMTLPVLAEQATEQGLPRSVSLELLRIMMRSREFDRRAQILYRQGRAWFHISSSGHEALAGAAVPLTAEDRIFPHYRDRSLLMARGMGLADMNRDLLATRMSHSAGRNMSAHFSFPAGNVFSVASPVGAQCLPAVGAAWAHRLEGNNHVVLCSVGEASTRQGEFYEAVSFAVDHDLPVIFLVSDNGYGISTSTRELAPFHRPTLNRDIVHPVDGADIEAVVTAVSDAVGQARTGKGPRILWCELDRLDSHTSSDDHRKYRSPGELACLRDPVALFAERLIARGWLTEQTLAQEWSDASADVTAHVDATIDEGHADPADLVPDMYAGSGVPAMGTAGECDRIVDAANMALKRGLLADPKMILFGEDIADPKGGVFGLTKGLSKFADDRIFNSPLAEATIVGVAAGLAASGWRPVVELQFIDFAGPAWNQIASQLTTLRWRTAGGWSCPVVIYAPYGGYLPGGGIWHSQSNEALFTHLPGLRVAVVSNPTDTEAAFLEAFASDDPTLILLPKHLLRVRQNSARDAYAPAGIARKVSSGSDVTVVTWGNGVELATSAAAQLADEGVSLDLIDLRWLAPWDRACVSESVRKTGRLVVIQEDNRTSSFGASVIEQLVTGDAVFGSLLAPPRLVTRADVHVPFHPQLEQAVLPRVDDVIEAVRSVMPQGAHDQRCTRCNDSTSARG